jgi:hypothetical protein
MDINEMIYADFTYFEQPVVYNNIDVYVVKYAAEESEL